MTGVEHEQTELAQVAYHAYGLSTGGKNYQGLPMPDWQDLPDGIQQAWVAAAVAVRDRVLNWPPAPGFAAGSAVLPD